MRARVDAGGWSQATPQTRAFISQAADAHPSTQTPQLSTTRTFVCAQFVVDPGGRNGYRVELTLNEAQNGAQLAVYMADTLVVRLREVPDAGCRWALASIDASCLEMTEHRYEAARAEVGSGGTSVWRFRPKRPGRTRLVLTKMRAWTAADAPPERFAVELELR